MFLGSAFDNYNTFRRTKREIVTSLWILMYVAGLLRNGRVGWAGLFCCSWLLALDYIVTVNYPFSGTMILVRRFLLFVTLRLLCFFACRTFGAGRASY